MKTYELADHLGNVSVLLSDRRIEMPKEMYADGLAADERYQRDQKNYTETVNQKHIPYGFGAATSLTKGKYLEAHTEDNLERIGSVIFNRKTGKVESVEARQSLSRTPFV